MEFICGEPSPIADGLEAWHGGFVDACDESSPTTYFLAALQSPDALVPPLGHG